MSNPHTNPITTEIIRNAFNSIAEDMNAALIRSAYTPVIYEGKDCAVALLDETGEVLGQSLGLPLFLGNLSLCVQIVADMRGWDYFGEGDVIFLNDSYIAGTHLNDVTVIMPIFWKGKRVGFATSRAHWLDVGAKDAGQSADSHEIYQEGMRWAPTKVYKNGEPCQEILTFLKLNSRFGDALLGDLHAQIAAGKTGEMRFNTLLDRFTRETVLAARDDIFRQSAEMERQTISAIPDGTYTAEGALDNDGLSNEPIPVKMKVDVKGDKVTIDLTGSAKQARGAVNCGETQTISAARVAFKLLINPERPVDGGTFSSLKVIAPEKSIFNAQEPAACSWYFSSLGLLIDLFVKAMSPVMPKAAAAAHYGDSMVIILSGYNPEKNDELYVSIEASTGGWGAWSEGDGQDCLINNVNGSFKDYPIEVYEHRYPVRIMKYGIRSDSGGAGMYRGGNGSYREYHVTSDTSLSLWFERSHTTAWGLDGGMPGKAPEVTITHPDNTVVSVLKTNAMPLKAGTVILTQTGGGGGYGDASKRDAAHITRDLKNAYITEKEAHTRYNKALS
ncbi:hydantoinase B/oxoprolinase family protein [Kordiimonas pumila]|uniref:Hydantoinase B/oxoprolinase family protein n=1 Tax=Kordiimonas pumila TaxID=2161677 RepID=A0ABV7D3Y5_9PROT|nr:hydantoinase B/oxoprolinase family protein [Kordiimonas pumila]